jgi:hypothetical protein
MTSWSRRFDDPIVLPDGRELATLRYAIAWLAKTVSTSSSAALSHGLGFLS